GREGVMGAECEAEWWGGEVVDTRRQTGNREVSLRRAHRADYCSGGHILRVNCRTFDCISVGVDNNAHHDAAIALCKCIRGQQPQSKGEADVLHTWLFRPSYGLFRLNRKR